MMDTDTATETRVALTVAVPQSPEEELFGAGVQVREPGPAVTVKLRLDLSRLDALMEELQRRTSEIDEMLFERVMNIPPHVWRAQTHGSFASSVGTGASPVEQVVRYHPEHWHSVYNRRAAAACCTPSRRPVTGGGYDGMRYVPLGSGEEGGE